MACSKFQYVKHFEQPHDLLKNTFIVVRIDGKGFSKFTNAHGFEKPNDDRGIELMNCAALSLMKAFTEIIIGYGQSDEYSFVLKKSATTYSRREDKILSTMVSHFTSAYIFNWCKFFPDQELEYPPTFDARIILYPTIENLMDYLSWRQADCHVNNLYNTTFWLLVHNNSDEDKTSQEKQAQAHEDLKGTFSKDKHEIMHKFGVNYNNEKDIYRRGSILVRQWNATQLNKQAKKEKKRKSKEEEKKEETKEEKQDITTKKKPEIIQDKEKSVIIVHEDLVDKMEFYERHDLFEKLK
ncbi:unnamed protein product [Moneuplotes crassus]|uniref:tRNA(His) guanylyltransferase n=1 Tax=Euplotes crassus TaxID=5936 RepID=A0AAD2CZX7_EUPCR|nr:unnamed protein product [Moneuplotes crassus]